MLTDTVRWYKLSSKSISVENQIWYKPYRWLQTTGLENWFTCSMVLHLSVNSMQNVLNYSEKKSRNESIFIHHYKLILNLVLLKSKCNVVFMNIFRNYKDIRWYKHTFEKKLVLYKKVTVNSKGKKCLEI